LKTASTDTLETVGPA